MSGNIIAKESTDDFYPIEEESNENI